MKQKFNILIRKKRFWTLSVFIVLLLLLYIFRICVLHGVYNFLNVSETPNHMYDYAIILGGDALDRPVAAAKLYHEGKIKQLICTGSQVPRQLLAAGITTTEAEATRNRLLALNVPDSVILMLPVATSTREEADALDELFKHKKRTSLLIITTETHTRRALSIFNEYCDEWNTMTAYGVAPTHYDSKIWWKNEFGFLSVFEEYLKTIYYWIAY